MMSIEFFTAPNVFHDCAKLRSFIVINYSVRKNPLDPRAQIDEPRDVGENIMPLEPIPEKFRLTIGDFAVAKNTGTNCGEFFEGFGSVVYMLCCKRPNRLTVTVF